MLKAPLIRDTKAILTGFATTLKHLLQRPVTIQYPEQKRTPPPRYRARIVLTRDPDGEERCVACYLCSAACPVDCISIQATESPEGRRYPEWFRINFARCIYCGLCADACPTLAIQMTPDYEFCKRNIMEMIYEKEDLLIDNGGKDGSYNYYRHAGMGVVQPRGSSPGEEPPVDPRDLMP
ncbi:NADH-quinone oxidoreductase subunit NuoI [Geobacter sp. DSM 9736]|uniref:NADH-quinone oxidoreductase subunit NuoI n=1 Tax=Geobacter sp. DSM 9736 TaxID=1277350 RepID=UPI000B5116BB|nr:NADH-quinone oxidoreductase subunit NuoI [Geobacter sp. DSM 9736]SNB46942.1 NADH dehydrogenase subunit I [Geobacter sp. DSM 9736]